MIDIKNKKLGISSKLNKRGMTLVETLVAMLILSMVTSIVAAGIPSAVNAYGKIVMVSNAEVLLSTTISKLRNELSTASDIVVNADKTEITYYSSRYNTYSRILTKNEATSESGETPPKKPAEYQMYTKTERSDTEGGPITYLVSSEAATGNLYVTFDTVEYSNGIVTFSNLSVHHPNKNNALTSRPKYSILVINSGSNA